MRGKKSYLARGWRWLAAFLAVLWRRPVAVSWLTDGGSKRRCCDLLPPPCCFDTASSLCFRCSFCQQRSSLSTVASWRCWCCWRLVAVSWLTDGGSKQRQRQRSYFFQCFPMILPVCFLQVFNSSFLLLCFGLSLSLSLSLLVFFVLPLFSLRFFLSSGSLPLFLCFSFFSLLSFPPPSVSVFLGSIYRAKGVAFYCSHGEQPAGRPLGATAKVRLPPVFWQVRGGWSASVFGRWAPGERGPGKIQTKAPFSFFPAAMFGGEKKEEQCPSKRHRSALFFFFLIKCMKRRRFGENAPFHLNVAPARANFQISPQSSFVHFNCIPAKISSCPYSWPRVSLWSLASDLCN